MATIRHILVTGNGGFGMVLTGNAPVVVTSLDPNSPAEKGGIEVGDVLVQLDGIDAAMLTHKQVIEYLRPFVTTTLLFGVIKLTPTQLDTYRERIRQLAQQQQLVRRWSASSMQSAASLALILGASASPASPPLSPIPATTNWQDEPEVLTSRPIASRLKNSDGANGSQNQMGLPSVGAGGTGGAPWPQQGALTKSKLISMSLMDDISHEEERAEERRAEDLAALGLGSGTQKSDKAVIPAAATSTAASRKALQAAPLNGNTTSVPAMDGHSTKAAAKDPAGRSESRAALATSATRENGGEQDDYPINGDRRNGARQPPTSAPAASWLNAPVSGNSTSLTTEMSWNERERAVPMSEQKVAAARTKSFAKRFTAAQSVYDSHATLAHKAVEAALKKSDKTKLNRLTAQVEEMEASSILRRVLFLDGRPIYTSKGTISLQHGKFGGRRLYLFFNESHAAWVFSTDPSSTEVLGFCPDGAQKPDMLRKPWYFGQGGDIYTVDEAVKLRRGGSQKSVSFSRNNSSKRIQLDGSLTDSQPDLIQALGDADIAQRTETEDAVFKDDEVPVSHSAAQAIGVNSVSRAANASGASSRVLILGDREEATADSIADSTDDNVAHAVAVAAAQPTDSIGSTNSRPKAATAMSVAMSAAPRPRASTATRNGGTGVLSGSAGDNGRRWSIGATSTSSSTDYPTFKTDYPRFEGEGDSSAAPENTFTLAGDERPATSSKRSSVASSDDPFAYLSSSASSLAAADDGKKKRRNSFGRKEKKTKDKGKPVVAPLTPAASTAADDPFAYLSSSRSSSVNSQGGSGRRKK